MLDSLPLAAAIALSAAAILVELAAHRYTPRSVDFFLRDPATVGILALVLASVVAGGRILPVASLVALALFVGRVLHALDPRRLVARIREEALREIGRAGAKGRAIRSLDGLFDLARGAVRRLDRSLATAAIAALRDTALAAARERPRLEALRRSTDFAGFSDAALRAVEAEGSWVERKVLRQLSLIFEAALGSASDICGAVALAVREVGADALARSAPLEARLACRAFNALIGRAIDARAARAAGGALAHYGLLGAAAVAGKDGELARELVRAFREHARSAARAGLDGIRDLAAHELAALARAALASGAPDALLLEIVDGVISLGDRRAQAALAAHLLMRGREDLARRLKADMAAEGPERLRAIRAEVLAAEREPFELSDRAPAPGYVPPEERPFVERFFECFA